MLIANDGADPVSGHFYNEPEGSALTLGGVTFYITYDYNYEAGTFNNGNDVALVVSTPPTANPDAYTTLENQSTSGNVLSNDTINNQENGLSLSVASVSVTTGGTTTTTPVPAGGSATVSTAAGGSLTMYSSGSFNYTPPVNFLGYDGQNTASNENIYVNFDGIQDSSPATLQFLVNAPPIVAAGAITH